MGFYSHFIPLSLWLCFVSVALMWLNHVGQVTDILPEQKRAVTFIDPQKGSHLGVVVHYCAVLCCARQDKSSGTAAQTELLLGDSVGQTCTWGSAQKTQLWGRLTLPCTLAERSQYYHCRALTLSPPIPSPLSAPAFSSLSRHQHGSSFPPPVLCLFSSHADYHQEAVSWGEKWPSAAGRVPPKSVVTDSYYIVYLRESGGRRKLTIFKSGATATPH